jgi:DNA polymerase-1
MDISQNVIKSCYNCDLCNGVKTPFIQADGPIDAEVLIAGEAPGGDEDSQGKPFVGRAGKLLREGLLQLPQNIKVRITNIVKCRPPGNRNPKASEVKACWPHFEDEIREMPNLKLIVAVGNISLKAILGTTGITKESGHEFTYGKYKVMPILHPAYILRNQEELKTFYDHIDRIPIILSGQLTDPKDKGVYTVIKTIEQWRAFKSAVLYSHLKNKFAYDIETNGLNPFAPDMVIKCIGFSTAPRIAYVLPITQIKTTVMEEHEVSVNVPVWTAKEWDELYLDLKYLFESKRIGKMGQNIKFDNMWMKQILKIDVKSSMWDTKIAEFLLPKSGSTNLKDMAWKYSRLGGYENKLPDKPHLVDGQELWDYNAIDTDLVSRIQPEQSKRMDPGLQNVMKTLMMPVSDVLCRLEAKGILIDEAKVNAADGLVAAQISTLLSQLQKEMSVAAYVKVSGEMFNPNSHTQLREILYKYEGLTPFKFTDKTGQPSTDQEVLEKYKDTSNLCKLLYEYSLYNQMSKTFIKELRDYMTPDNRIHTQYWLTETVTGRTSSRKPNLQNIPKGDKDIVAIRNCFIADPDYVLAEFDFNQHELRVMAELSGDDNLKKALLSGDVHTATTANILGINPQNVTSEQRRLIGKTFNFGIIYGMSPWGIKERLGCSEDQAKNYLAKFFMAYWKVQEWMNKIRDYVNQNGYVYSMTGRRRRFPSWEALEEKNFREAINFPVQSLASDILLYSLIGIDLLLTGRKSFLTLEVHDSIVCNIHRSELDLIGQIKDVMLSYFQDYLPDFKMPLEVDVAIGPNWGELVTVNGNKS